MSTTTKHGGAALNIVGAIITWHLAVLLAGIAVVWEETHPYDDGTEGLITFAAGFGIAAVILLCVGVYRLVSYADQAALRGSK